MATAAAAGEALREPAAAAVGFSAPEATPSLAAPVAVHSPVSQEAMSAAVSAAVGAGGGGGYSGGTGGFRSSGGGPGPGGGGGSFDAGIDQILVAGIQTGNGEVVITAVAPVFAGTPGKGNCHGKSVSALAKQYGGLNRAAAALGFDSVSALQDAIMAFCGG
jgi:hypothetical protein